ncbi:hypothetical protein AVEN_16083-1 [Araneus ventricosus]|uniref:Uncharacterized protein n=1 Tax=Araneus ventricosus TaxID=182803 RepID=A0A4Y2S9G3_ARAVE|nr:hypothetical protein AVEN_106885-1 [Araneus ventricosus]GBO31347.1 hypothetical protein AVEN_16083-1 [Araneus ventricosus]
MCGGVFNLIHIYGGGTLLGDGGEKNNSLSNAIEKTTTFRFLRPVAKFCDSSIHPGEVAGQPISFHGYGQTETVPRLRPPSLRSQTQNSIPVFINVYDSFGYASLERWGQRTGTDWEPSFRERDGCGGGVEGGGGPELPE